MSTLCVIPARGGSQGIPHKNLRLINGLPLVIHALTTVEALPQISRVIVTTDDPQIAAVVRLHGGDVLDRPAGLATDDCPITPVIQHAVASLGWSGPVLTFQPTCPTVTTQDLIDLLDGWQTSGYPSGGIVTPAPHIYWTADGPLTERVQRQDGGTYRELGVFVSAQVAGGLVSDPHYRHVVESGIDIDSFDDLVAARRALGRKRIEFRVRSGPRVGLGHVRRCESLAAELAHHDCRIVNV